MEPFALPVPNHRLGIYRQERQEGTSEQEEGIDSQSEPDLLPSPAPASRLPPDSINPLSHSPDTLRQFAVAGLAPEEELPSQRHPLFPHKPLPRSPSSHAAAAGGRERELGAGTGREQRRKRDPKAAPKEHAERLRHLGTLTTVLHRCLADGDIARAKRALSLLLRTADVDIRLGGLWALGSEILMRDGEDEGRLGGPGGSQGREAAPPRCYRWGSPANVERVRAYLDGLIQQHPYDVHRPRLASAFDFWPALFGIEIYSLGAEFEHALRLSLSHDDDGGWEEEEKEEEDELMAYSYEALAFEKRGRSRRRRRGAAARDDLRHETRAAAEVIAARMDRVMETPPYAAHREMLRLRGHLALFVADLHLPSRIVDGGNDDLSAAADSSLASSLSSSDADADAGTKDWRAVESDLKDLSLDSSSGGGGTKEAQEERVLRRRARGAEEHGALDRRAEERERARAFFRRLREVGGEREVDGWVAEFLDAGEEREEEEE